MLDDLATPPPWVHIERFCDVQSQAAQYQGYRQEYQQLSPGAFEGRVTSYDLGSDFVVQLETSNQELAFARSRARQRWGVCMLAETSHPCVLNGTTLTRDHFVVCPEGKALFGKSSAGAHVYCMDVSRELLVEETAECNSVEIIYDAHAVQSFREVLVSGLTTLVHLQSSRENSVAARAFKLSLTDALWRINTRAKAPTSAGVTQCAKRRASRLFRVAREYINEHLTDGVSVGAVCNHSGASRRSVERTFHTMLGMGPEAYIRNLQLNRVRHDLLSGMEQGVSIGDVAARYGIWHWSRFSQQYKLLFGELPSQTRGRSRRGSI